MDRPNTPEEKYYLLAKKRVQQKKRFFNHLKSFVIVNVVMSFVVALDGNPFDFLPATLFWGMGLAFHYIKVFGIPGTNILTPEWEDQEIEKEMDRIKGKRIEEFTPAPPPQPEAEPKEESLELKELRKNYDERDLV
ncbi:MAG: 2TM domain-containing protein [Saprospirales bacterium]|nr:2TM domain-containing protein [Saprospirales bacterium]MBK8492357.1 2TM domain-containing protein [Saprospirales bacterium]